MQRPSKKEIKAALERLKEPGPNTSGTNPPGYSGPTESAKKPNKNRIRKQGV